MDFLTVTIYKTRLTSQLITIILMMSSGIPLNMYFWNLIENGVLIGLELSEITVCNIK